MRDTNIVNALREHAEWAQANEWETPITLCDDLAEAADQLENQNAHIAALQQEIEKLRGQVPRVKYEDTGLTPQEVISMQGEWCAMMSVLNSIGGGYTRLRELAEADRAGRLVVLPWRR